MTRREILLLGWLVALVLCAGAHRVAAQDIASETDPVLTTLGDRASLFLEGVSLGQASKAYPELLAGSQLLKQKEPLQNLVEKTGELHQKYGPYRAFEQIAATRVGSDLVLLKYLYKCERFPVVWYFTYYRTPGETPAEGGTWQVIIVRFDTELELLGYE